MYCYKCGAQIPDDSVFCAKCGAKIVADSQHNASPSIQTNGVNSLDRKALIIYLNDLLALEYILKKYNVQLAKMEKEVEYNNYWDLKNTFYYNFFPQGEDDWINYYGGRSYFSPTNNNNYTTCLHFMYKENGSYYILMMYGDQEKKWIPYFLYGYFSYRLEWKEIDNNLLSTLMNPETWNEKMIQSDYFNSLGNLFGRKEKQKILLKIVKVFEESFNSFKLMSKQGLADSKKDVIKTEIDYKGAIQEKEKFAELLKKTYGLNIIPNQYRNIYAVYYLYDYLHSSNETLTTALMHFDLNQIKSKLDKIIEQQEEIIINQVYQQSQNDQLLKQNQEYLRKLDSIDATQRRIENAANETAVYASIAASNAEAAALIGLANYLK